MGRAEPFLPRPNGMYRDKSPKVNEKTGAWTKRSQGAARL